MVNLGVVRPGSTIYVPFDTFQQSNLASVTISNLALGDILVYKDGGTTQRASTSGFTLLDTDGIDFDSNTGIHGVSIDLADNTTSGFWSAGSRYFVVIGPFTCDGQTRNIVAAVFEIGTQGSLLDTTIATLSSQTSFTLTAGPAEDDALNGCQAIIYDIASGVQRAVVTISDYTGSTKTVTLSTGATFTVAAGDNICVMPLSFASIWTSTLTEAYRGTGAAGTAAQLLYEILQNLTEFAISGSTKTVKKIDGSTTAKTYTLNSSSAPTSITETT